MKKFVLSAAVAAATFGHATAQAAPTVEELWQKIQEEKTKHCHEFLRRNGEKG